MRPSTLLVAAAGTGAALIGGLALRTADLGQQPWFVSRASGLVAFALLSASVVLGLMMSTRLAKRLLPGRLAYELHGFLAVLGLVFIGIHSGALLFDGFFAFTPLALVVPFVSPYAPLWVGLGVVAAWSAALLAASVRLRKQIGYRRWRQLHYLSFVAYLFALIHGMTAGTDTGLAAVRVLYFGSAALAGGLIAWRVFAARSRRPAPRPARERSGRLSPTG